MRTNIFQDVLDEEGHELMIPFSPV